MLDELTGLWNRRAWERFRETEEARCRRYGHSACVLSIDLDGLKAANDQRGHEAGDELLRRAAQALRQGVRDQDVVARVGGDEFAVLLVECTEEQGRVVEQRLRAQLRCASVAASLGFARREPATGLDQAWARADAAMYCEKRARKACASR
jgi:diguanylate cyclase (GGDEF)-like protein